MSEEVAKNAAIYKWANADNTETLILKAVSHFKPL